MKIPISDAIFVDNGKVLLVQQRKSSAYGLWSYPGGHVEEGETPKQAVHREVLEELGVRMVDARLFGVYPLKVATGELEIHSYTGDFDGDIVLKDDELTAYGWFDLDALESMQDKLRAPLVLQQAREVLMNTDAFGLERLGYDQYFDDIRVKLGAAMDQVARVTAEHKGAYEVMGATGAYRAAVTGKRMLTAQNRDDFPAVGDWVVTKNVPGDTKVILEVLPRRTTLHKKYGGKDEAQLIAANVDVAFIVESIDRDYSLNRFERYLVLAREGGVKPVIILNKSDLGSDAELQRMIAEIHERFGEIDVLATSIATDSGLNELDGYIKPGLTYCFLGSSGVGKSSLINRLLQRDSIPTKAIGAKTGRGRHTTTTREMYSHPKTKHV